MVKNMELKMNIKIIFFFIMFLSVAQSAENSNASFYVDMIPTTGEVENAYKDSTLNQDVTVAIRVNDFVKIKSFSVCIKYDTLKLEYIESTESTLTEKNVIDGGIFFDYEDGNIIEYVGSHQGGGSSNGNAGLMAVITFKSKLNANENTLIELVDASIISEDNEVDNFESISKSLNNGIYYIANNTQNMYVIDVLQSDYGSILPVGPILVKEGNNSPEFKIKTDSDATLEWIEVDSVKLFNTYKYEFVNVTDNHTLSARFKTSTSTKSNYEFNKDELNKYISHIGKDIIINSAEFSEYSNLSLIDALGRIVKVVTIKNLKYDLSLNRLCSDISRGFYFGIIKASNQKFVFPYYKY